ncbi:hypothetical protein TNIN_358721 [Trichonephila inaurata madagascariensis]|uniref:Uncharacterized protein n=1 Tax=Trichonephila inaurata madagascariensis TaxID=2747483 RepID=A0A8X7CA09_9ARAC|nr:hypothetical protein TNIN_358721 [Trichonephila inaurata madagascariensis]
MIRSRQRILFFMRRMLRSALGIPKVPGEDEGGLKVKSRASTCDRFPNKQTAGGTPLLSTDGLNAFSVLLRRFRLLLRERLPGFN